MNIELWNCKRVEENSVLAPRCRSLFRLTRFRLFLWASNGKRDPYRCAIVRFAFLFRSPMPPPPPLTPSSVLFAICIFFDSFAVYRFYLIECCWIRAQRERKNTPQTHTHTQWNDMKIKSSEYKFDFDFYPDAFIYTSTTEPNFFHSPSIFFSILVTSVHAFSGMNPQRIVRFDGKIRHIYPLARLAA